MLWNLIFINSYFIIFPYLRSCFRLLSGYSLLIYIYCRILGCTDFRTKGFALQSFTPHPLESHIERKPPHLLPYKLWSQGSSVPLELSVELLNFSKLLGLPERKGHVLAVREPWALFPNEYDWAYLSDVACSDCSAYPLFLLIMPTLQNHRIPFLMPKPFFRLLLRKRIEFLRESSSGTLLSWLHSL